MDTQTQSDLTEQATIPNNTMIASLTEDTDALHLLNVFPEELWRLILANANDANGYLRLCGISPLFKNLLEGQRVPVLLTAVVQVLICRRKIWEWEQNHWNPDADTRIHLKHLTRCRQVSRDWKNGIDRALHNLPYHHQFSEELKTLDCRFYYQVFKFHSTVFDSFSSLKAFEWWFNDSHLVTGANPFTTRALEIRIPFLNPELPDFTSKLLDVLRKCGTHAWYLTIKGDLGFQYRTPAKPFAYFLKDVLEQVPNLRALRYIMLNTFTFCEPLDCQFPPLKKLMFFNQAGLPYEIVKAHLHSAKPTQVGVTFYKETFLDVEKALNSFFQLCAPLTKLRLKVLDEKVFWDGIFSKLETFFGKSLTNLFISLPRTGLAVKSKELRLSSLKVLHLELGEPVPLDFLLGARQSLVSLTISIRNSMTYQEIECARKQERKLKIYHAAQCDKLYTSNIWEIFTNLEKLEMNGALETSRSAMESIMTGWHLTHSKSKKYC